MITVRNNIGFSNRIKLEWLEYTANIVLARNDSRAIKSSLTGMLSEKLKGGLDVRRGSIEKSVSILMKIWVHPGKRLKKFHEKGLMLISELEVEKHLAVHWGMTMAVYPFWEIVASHLGRLLKLNGVASHSQVRRRVMEQFGQRPTIRDATRRVLRSMVDWGVIRDVMSEYGKRKEGKYLLGPILSIKEPKLIAWLLESVLHSYGGEPKSFRFAIDAPSLFPFHLDVVSADQIISATDSLEFVRESSGQDLIYLKREVSSL